MFKKFRTTILPSLYIDIKNTRLFAPQYIMTLIIMPLSYLMVAHFAGGFTQQQGVGAFVFTSALSFFLSLVSTGVASLFKTEVMETYASLNVRMYTVLNSSLLYFTGIYLISSVVMAIIALCMGIFIHWWIALVCFLLGTLFFSRVAGALGLVLRNPYRGGALIPYFMFIILAITPLSTAGSPMATFHPMMLNPFYDVYLLISAIGQGITAPLPFIAVCAYLAVLTLLLECFIYKKCSGTFVLERIF